MTLPVAVLVLLLPWAMRGGAGWRRWAVAAALYPLGAALSVALALALPSESFAVVIPLERTVLAFGLAALVALALRPKGRDGPAAAFWMAHLGLVLALAGPDALARGAAWTGRPFGPGLAEAARFAATMGLLLGALGAALAVWRRR